MTPAAVTSAYASVALDVAAAWRESCGPQHWFAGFTPSSAAEGSPVVYCFTFISACTMMPTTQQLVTKIVVGCSLRTCMACHVNETRMIDAEDLRQPLLCKPSNVPNDGRTLSCGNWLLLHAIVEQLPHAFIAILLQNICHADVAAVHDAAGLHHMYEVWLYEVQQPLVVRDHYCGAGRRFQTIYSLRHVPERINVQPCVSNTARSEPLEQNIAEPMQAGPE